MPARPDAVRFVPHSLQGRMLMLSAVATVIALAIAGWVIVGVLERLVVEGLDRRLDAELSLLASTIRPDGMVDRDRLAQARGAFEPGPGWRWQIAGPAGSVGSADFASLVLAAPDPHRRGGDGPEADGIVDRIRPLDGRDGEGPRVHARRLTIHTEAGDVTLTAAAPRDVVSRPIRAALVPLLTALAVLALLLAIATIVQLRLGLRPIRRMRDQVAALRTGRRPTIDEEQPAELRPLAAELNALARDNAAALQSARQSAANLAHALKTPVTTLALDLRDDPARAAQVARIDATIRHHLARARATTADRRVSTPLLPVVEDVVAAVRRLHADRPLRYVVDVGDHAVAVDPHDLSELIGNLVDNASRHADATVRISAARKEDRRIRVTVADDGAGVPAHERAKVAQPGVRLDERGDGHGFGLSIVGELAVLYGGSLALSDAALSGLLAEIDLPAG